jgi:hypothetical protein
MPGISIGGHNINNLRYADDTVLIAEKETHLQEMINIIAKESLSKGLSLNIRKTEVMVITKNKCPPECNIKVDGTSLKQVSIFKYLGTLITADGRCIKEIKSRVAQAKATFHKMKNILCNMSLSIEVRKRVLRSYIEPIMLYGSEAWTINRLARNHIEATEMWFYRRMLRTPWTDKKRNDDILKEVNSKRELHTRIRRRQSTFFEHIMRRGKMEHIVTTGRMNNKRGRGRPREKILDSLIIWLGRTSASEIIRNTRDRRLWIDMITNASRHGL